MYSRYGNGRSVPSSLPQGYSGTAYTDEEPQSGAVMRTAGDMRVTVDGGMKTYRAREISEDAPRLHSSQSERIYRSSPALSQTPSDVGGTGSDTADNDARARYPLEDSERYTAHRPPRSRRRTEETVDENDKRRVRFPLERFMRPQNEHAAAGESADNSDENEKPVSTAISGEKAGIAGGELLDSIFGALSEHSFTLEDMMLIGLILLLLNEKADTETIILIGLLLFSSF